MITPIPLYFTHNNDYSLSFGYIINTYHVRMLNAFMLLVNLRLFGLYKYNVRQLWNALANTP